MDDYFFINLRIIIENLSLPIIYYIGMLLAGIIPLLILGLFIVQGVRLIRRFYKKRAAPHRDIPIIEKANQYQEIKEVSNFRMKMFLVICTLPVGIEIYFGIYELRSYLAHQTLYILTGLACVIYITNFVVGTKLGRKRVLPSKKAVLLLFLWLLLPPLVLATVGLWYMTMALTPVIISYLFGGLLGAIFGATRPATLKVK